MADQSSISKSEENILPEPFARWFEARNWQPRNHQLDLCRLSFECESALLIAPTGAGKTLAGFLPSLIDLARTKAIERRDTNGPHTLYISPLKALAVDVARNLQAPIDDMGLEIRVETRTGDTPHSRRRRQIITPPEMLMTTPEQLSLLLASPQADIFFAGLKRVVLDELHALIISKRGSLLALALSRLRKLAPDVCLTGLSATVSEPDDLRAYLVPQTLNTPQRALSKMVYGQSGAVPDVRILQTVERIPWAGHSTLYAVGEIYEAIKTNRLVLVFVNTRSQAEMMFQALWRINEETIPIALHHGSLDVGQRRKVEAAMVAGKLRAVVCTSTLDLGVDWGNVDLIINVGAPKGASRILQRIGRANHRLNEPSRALLVPSNRFEVLECMAAQEAARKGEQDSARPATGQLDVLAQHILGMACAGPFVPDELYREVCSAAPYQELERSEFDQTVEFVATGGYALKSYDRYARLKKTNDGKYRLAHPRMAQQYRLNIGTIVADTMLKVRLVKHRPKSGSKARSVFRGGRILGEVEEGFIDQLSVGDTFLFSGEVLRFEGLGEVEAYASKTSATEPKIPSYYGGKFPLSTYLAQKVRDILADEKQWAQLPGQVSGWLRQQKRVSVLPSPSNLLIETFPRGTKHYLVAYPFEGRLAHQTLGMLLTRRLERMGAKPLGFVANEYTLAIWGLSDMGKMCSTGSLSFADLFDEDMLGDDLDAWLASSSLLKRTFKNCAIISGLIERRYPGREKSGRQITFSTDLIYDVLRNHEPDHILLKATWADAASGLLDIARLGQLLSRIKGRIVHKHLDSISPLAVPVMLEIGREPIYGEANEALLAEAADALFEEVDKIV